jgi:hypothetical protein
MNQQALLRGQSIKEPEVILSEEKIVFGLGLFFNADYIPNEISKATLHVFSVRLDGEYTATVKNTGILTLRNTSINHHYLKEVSQDFTLFKNISQGLGKIRRNSSVPVKVKWSVSGVLNVLWALIQIFFTGTVRVKTEAIVNALLFSKKFTKDVRLPVRSVSVEWN